MEPAFTSGDCIIVRETEQKEIAVGDIITFVSGDPSLQGGFNTHRIIDIATDHTDGNAVYYTKGDKNNWEDEYTVLYEDIVGKYVYTLPFGEQISSFLEKLSDRNYYFAVVIIPVLLCFISSIRQLVKDAGGRKS
jgi:signal peptidase